MCAASLGRMHQNVWRFTLFPADISSFPSKDTECEPLQVWHVMNCHQKHQRGYKYQHLCSEKETDALVLLWPRGDTTACNRWRQHLRLAFDLQECVFSLSTGWSRIYTPPGAAMMRFIQHSSVCTPRLRWWTSTKFCPAGPCRNVLTQTSFPHGPVKSEVQVRMWL